jgi:cysteine desulfurase
MPRVRAYLDYNASAPLLPAARQAMLAALDVSANPSSVHAEGRRARRIVEEARRDVAALVGGSPENVLFTSGATEAASNLLFPHWQYGRARVLMSRLYVSAADHFCLLKGGRFPPEQVVTVAVKSSGLADLEALDTALRKHERGEGLPLVAIHLANNETGVVQPVRRISEAVKAAGGAFVVDAVQAAGRMRLDIGELGADFLILSAHKIGGPTGCGAVVSASSLMMPLPMITGGGQEKGHRAGTENLTGIAGFGAAARDAAETAVRPIELLRLRDRIEEIVLRLAPEARIFGRGVERLPNTVLFAVPGLSAETGQIGFDLAGVAVSAGSACSSGKVGPSHVLKAMGVHETDGALRVSIGHRTTEEEVAIFEAALTGILARRLDGRTKAA